MKSFRSGSLNERKLKDDYHTSKKGKPIDFFGEETFPTIPSSSSLSPCSYLVLEGVFIKIGVVRTRKNPLEVRENPWVMTGHT